MDGIGMAQYCEICGEELDSEEKDFGICDRCRNKDEKQAEYQVDNDYIDPGIT
jgi:ribosome-binding protein aMBF1 (putative translation factor)